MKTNKRILLIVILCIASFFRLYLLGSNPPHLTPDEAALGYNAYSIAKTGRDEYGKPFPIIFKSFGDYKPGLYVYADIPFVISLGLNEFSTRLPSAISGVVAVLLFFHLLKLLFPDKKNLPLIGSFLLALSPWHIYFSRGAWEINLALTLTLAAIYYFLKAKSNAKYFIFSAVFFALTLLAYQGAKLSSAIVLLLLILTSWKDVIKVRRDYLFYSMLLGVVVSSPIILSLFTGQAGRLSVFSVFNSPRPEKYLNDFLSEGNEKVGDASYYLYHSEKLNFLRGIMGRWFNHFSGRFLFFEGDWAHPRHAAPYTGLLTIFDLPLLLIGIAIALRKKLTGNTLFVALWLIFACLPAILSRDQVHAVRSYNMVIPLVIVISLGFDALVKKLNRKVYLLLAVGIYLVGFSYFLVMYFVQLPKLNSKYWEYGYKQLVETIHPIQNKYENIIFQQSYAQPYIYFLYFTKYEPNVYQKFANDNFIPSPYGDVGQISKLDNISFEGIDWQVLRGKTGTIVVGDAERIPPGDSKEGTEFHVVNDIKYLDNKTDAFRIIEIK